MLSIAVLGSIALLIGLLAWGRIQAFKLFVGLVFIFYLTDLISLQELLGNFVNPALVTLVFLLLVSSVLEKTSLFSWLADWLQAKGQRSSIARMSGTVGVGSAFLNNTAMVASFMSLIGRSKENPPSKLLIPLSYIAIFGGTLTLIGTSTHLIINGFLIQSGLPELGIFDFFYVGIFILLFGTITVLLIAPYLLPKLEQKKEDFTEYLIEARLSKESELSGLSIEQAGLRQLEDLFLVQVISSGAVHSPVSPKYVLKGGDRLVFAGDIKAAPKLMLLDGLSFHESDKEGRQQKFVEVVVSQQSPMIGASIKRANFRNKFDAAVVAICRGDQKLDGKLADVILQSGDALVLMVGSDFEKRENLKRNFYFYSDVETTNQLNNKTSLFALAGFFSVITLAALSVIPLIKGLMLLLAFYLLFGLTSVNEVRRRIPVDLILIIGSALGIAGVLSSSGAAAILADSVMASFGYWGIWGSFIGIYLLTVLITEMVTNNAAAALGFPIAIATSEALGVSALPFVMAVAYGASASFITPYGYQTNLMVYSAGGYRFMDYVKMGIPVSIVYGLTVLLLVPVFFPFT